MPGNSAKLNNTIFMFLVIIILYSTLFCVLRRCASFLCVCVCVFRVFLGISWHSPHCEDGRADQSVSSSCPFPLFSSPFTPMFLRLVVHFHSGSWWGRHVPSYGFLHFPALLGLPILGYPFSRERVWHTLCQCHATPPSH